ncbi:protein patched-like [Macrosteles quadrilineatus]|uniref:protein patched-like n=1 Tax=Macrosteles quadrilineatus TaxID=74068 RepID=UPI0023E120DC|nr:protein patched-like [Macrosteles quadrilineatus]
MVFEQPRHTSDLFVRTSWIDAGLALSQIDKGRAEGRRTALWFRARLQSQLFQLGCFLHRHAGKVLFVALLVLSSFCVGLKSAVIHSRAEQLWVEEGGRLEAELRYSHSVLGEAEASTHQLIIQTPKEAQASLLHPGALLGHLDVVKAAASVTVNLFDITWRLKDMCYSPSIPNFDIHYIDQIFENMIPCAIITPLDCFWEGSKLLGPDYPVAIPGVGTKVKWTNLNPLRLMDRMKNNYEPGSFPFSTLEQHLKRAGISTGYQEKPCLNPKDSECPSSSPNKATGQIPDIGAELTGGCYGFAAKYMHWPEDLIVGGAKRNKTGHIQKAHALQTVIQLMGEKELYEFWSDTYKVHHVAWSQEKAALVLETWQRRFSEEVKRQMSGSGDANPSLLANYNFFAFSTATLNDILCKFSEPNYIKVAITYACMILYAAVSLVKWHDPIKSQCTVGIAGIILVSISVAAGLGLCAVLGIAFNATITQIVPFLALGLGVDNMFLLTHMYAEQSSSEAQFDEQIGVLLKKSGVGMLLSSLSKVLTFIAAALIPIPALRVFSLQIAILCLFNLGTMLFVFPAILSLDIKRRRAGRPDLLCCYLPSPTSPLKRSTPEKRQTITRALPPDRQQTVTSVVTAPATPSPQLSRNDRWSGSTNELINEPGSLLESLLDESCVWRGVGSWYAPYLCKGAVKFTAVVCMIGVLVFSIWGITKLTDGLDLTDIVPRGTTEHSFLAAQGRYFGFYNMYAVTGRDFEYPTNQRLLYEYHESFMRVHSVIKNDNGGLPEFWLGLFRDWLIDLQKAFDRDWSNGCITQEFWFKNASDEGILAYKLLVQTGHVDNPVDKSLITQVRLVNGDGIINPKAFYNYLSAWASNDALAYGASQANLRPEPKEWFHVPSEHELKIPKSAPLVYAQLPFYLHGLGDTTKITKLIKQVRDLCQRFEARGLPNFPSGIPFLFWEQYLTLRQTLGIALLTALAAVFVLVSVMLVNIRAAVVVTVTLAMMIVQLLGLMGAVGIKLSAVPAVLLIVSVGIGAHYTVHMCLSFLTSIGRRNRRMRLAVDHMFTPIVQGGLATMVAIAMLSLSEFEFVVRYFFYILVALIGVGLTNGLFFFPVLLSLFGPAAEVVPLHHPDRISTPSPEPVRRSVTAPKCRVAPPPSRSRHAPPQREPSLTTITEEPSWHSQTHEATEPTQTIVVEPEFVVETTTCTHPHVSGSGSDSSSGGSHRDSSQPQSQPHVTTKVTATAKVKVEVCTPIHGGMDKTRHIRRHSRDSSSDSSTSSSRHS